MPGMSGNSPQMVRRLYIRKYRNLLSLGCAELCAEGSYRGCEKPENFWEHTSDNKIIELFLKRRDFDVTEKFEKLLNGEAIRESVNENVSYDFLTSTEENLWSLLYLTGYLTKVKEKHREELPQERNKITLKIPNAEIQDIFRKSVLNWLQEKNMYSDRKELFEALWKGDSEKLPYYVPYCLEEKEWKTWKCRLRTTLCWRK